VSAIRGVRVAGTGAYLPERVVTNDDFAKQIDTNDEWIRSRTGIRERRFAADDEAASDMAIAAAREALAAAEASADDVDLIICATMTPDHSIPSTAALVQGGIGASKAGGFDLGAACSGFVMGLTTAAAHIKSGLADRVLVVGSEKMSTVMDFEDRGTCVIFADGAGAAVVEPAPAGESDVLAQRSGLRGDAEVLVVPAGGSRRPPTAASVAERAHFVKMKGRDVFKFAVKTFTSLIQGTCADAGIRPEDVTLVVPHQVNLRILETATQRTGIDLERCIVNIDRYGNTSAASVPIALDEAVRGGRVAKGDLVLMVAFGAGLSWASTLLRW